MQDLKIQDFNLGMKFSIENGFFNLTPPWLQKNRAWDFSFAIENEHFKPRMTISSENDIFRACGNGLFKRSSENDFFFRSLGPLGFPEFF